MKSVKAFNSLKARNAIVGLMAAGLIVMQLVRGAAAQTPEPAGPIYVVQANENLSTIAGRFNISIGDLMAANEISNPNLISEGQRLVIPGLKGVTGILSTETVAFGESFRSIVRQNQIPADLMRRLNHLVSPTEFYVGAGMIVPQDENAGRLTARYSTQSQESLFETAVTAGTDSWSLAAMNELAGSWDGIPGDVLYGPGESAAAPTTPGLPPAFLSADIPTLPLKQGMTAEIFVSSVPGTTLGGHLGEYTLHFFPADSGTRMVALQGIYARLQPGVYPLQLDATLPDGTEQSFRQSVLVNSGGFPKESLAVPPETIDPTVTGPEDQEVQNITSAATDTRMWDGEFQPPVDSVNAQCLRDRFGTLRSFNGSDYIYFHSGLDYGICSVAHPFEIYAAAPGTVVFAGPLNVRGNATFINHGWGVYTGYFHQEEFHVSVGQQVQAGELIGKIGATGRVTGPHLHFEVWVNGIQVNPEDWLARAYP
jgi:murein DD-endopeptidase MepM/ murein hydrolase activator NlpD